MRQFNPDPKTWDVGEKRWSNETATPKRPRNTKGLNGVLASRGKGAVNWGTWTRRDAFPVERVITHGV